MMKRILSLLGLLSIGSTLSAQVTTPRPVLPAPNPAESEADYIRYVEEPGSPERLQTAVVRFAKDGHIVDLVGVVHLGDEAYFENLNAYLQPYDAVLYEMVGGKYSPPVEGTESKTSIEEMGSIRGMQQMTGSFLGLHFQLDGINYESPNFIHADVDAAEFQSLMTARNQNFNTLFTRAMSLSESDDLGGLPTSEEDITAFFTNIMSAVTSGNPNELKRSIAPLMSEAEGFIAKIEGDDGTVLVTERNKVVMRKLHEVLASSNPREIAIFYGAGHMPDLEARLIADGYTKGETAWADAWTMDDSVPLPEGTRVFKPGDMLVELLNENPEIMSSIQQLSEMLGELSKAAGE